MPEIEAKNITLTYLEKNKVEINALDNFSAVFKSNSFNVILGYSGCGKTTLLKVIAGIYGYDGEIFFDGVNVDTVPTSKRSIAYITQQYSLYPHLTIFDNIAFPLKVIGANPEEITKRVNDMASKLGLIPCLTRKPKHLSGGQQQRVALARALIKNPAICLMDEPLSNVDETMRVKARKEFKDALTGIGCTVIYVTHNVVEAMSLADELFVMDEGKLIIKGKPLEVYNSGNPIVESLKGEIKQ